MDKMYNWTYSNKFWQRFVGNLFFFTSSLFIVTLFIGFVVGLILLANYITIVTSGVVGLTFLVIVIILAVSVGMSIGIE